MCGVSIKFQVREDTTPGHLKEGENGNGDANEGGDGGKDGGNDGGSWAFLWNCMNDIYGQLKDVNKFNVKWEGNFIVMVMFLRGTW